jgi:hypothetical protein
MATVNLRLLSKDFDETFLMSKDLNDNYGRIEEAKCISDITFMQNGSRRVPILPSQDSYLRRAVAF